MPKLKREGAGFLSITERQKLQRLYTQGDAAYGSLRNLAKASNLSVSKVRQFLHSKFSYTKFTLATRKFKRIKAFASLKNEIWCMDLAYVDNLAKGNNGVKYLLVRQGLFDRTVDAKGMKTKASKETVCAVLSMITKKNRPKKVRVDKGREFAGEFKKLCQAEGKQIYSTMSETKAAFAERTIRSLKKYTLPLHGRQWIQLHSQIDSIRYNTELSKKLLDRLDTKECKKFRLFVHSVQQNTTRI